MASPWNQHCTNCIGTLSFPIVSDLKVSETLILSHGNVLIACRRFQKRENKEQKLIQDLLVSVKKCDRQSSYSEVVRSHTHPWKMENSKI